MALGSCISWQSFCVYSIVVFLKKQDELTSARSNIGSYEVPIPLEALTILFVLFPIKDLFTKFMKMFTEMMQVQAQALAKMWKYSFKMRTPETN